jgi:4-amino-4-deoxy-L-arabinose transferase-like glycosyltransferase
LGFVVVLVLAAFFRLWHLSTLPPGLAPGEAQIGLAAYALLHHGIWPNFSLATGGSPLLVMLEAISIWLFGLTDWVLRLVPALVGIAAVGVGFIWARAWFGRRTALIAAFLLAVTPWAVTLSRNVEPAALAPLLLTLLLWLATRLWHDRSTKKALLLGLVAILAILSGPVGWGALFVTVVAAFGVAVKRTTRRNAQKLTTWLLLAIIFIVPTFLIFGVGQGRGRAVIAIDSFGQFWGGLWATFLAFQIHGDDSYLHNLGGEPLLNVFVGIMMIAGILVAITRWRQRPSRVLLLGAAAAMVPALLDSQTAPNAAKLALMLPFSLVLAAIGIGYMLEVWYATFPINSAARLSGQLAILILLGLTAYQGYTQYFVAWADSSETHRAYGDAAIGLSSWVKQLPAGTTTTLVADADDSLVLRYQLLNASGYQIIELAPLPAALKQRPLHLGITTTWRDQVIAQLKTTAAGGTLVSHQSSFDQADLYYTYELP